MKQLLVLLALSSPFVVIAQPSDLACVQLAKDLSESWGREIPCYCQASELAHVQLRLPVGLKLSSVCAPRKDTQAFVNLRFETINMDQVVGTDGFV